MEMGKQIFGFEPSAVEMLARYDWPGNYTQFKHVLQEAASRTDGMYISGTVLAELLARERKFHYLPENGIGSFPSENLTLAEITRKIVEHSLAENGGNQSLTARKLGISRSTLWRMLGSAPENT